MITDERKYRKLEKEKNKKLNQIDNLKVEIEIIDEEMKNITLNYVDIKVKELNLSLFDIEKILSNKKGENNEYKEKSSDKESI